MCCLCYFICLHQRSPTFQALRTTCVPQTAAWRPLASITFETQKDPCDRKHAYPFSSTIEVTCVLLLHPCLNVDILRDSYRSTFLLLFLPPWGLPRAPPRSLRETPWSWAKAEYFLLLLATFAGSTIIVLWEMLPRFCPALSAMPITIIY